MIQERADVISDVSKDHTDVQPNATLSTADLAGRAKHDSQPVASETAASDSDRVPLFPEGELGDSRRRWQDIQASFVDDPRSAVRSADELVASLMTRLAQVFADERGKLEHEWDKGENVSTEDLRVALRRYRSFFDRLLSV
jgi:hypothetical protein